MQASVVAALHSDEPGAVALPNNQDEGNDSRDGSDDSKN